MKLNCSRCKTDKLPEYFRKNRSRPNGHSGYCKVCEAAYRKDRRGKNYAQVRQQEIEYRGKNRDRQNKQLSDNRKTFIGKINRTYSNMKDRVTGTVRSTAKGQPLLDKQSFTEWSRLDKNYRDLYKDWKKSGFKLALSPSIDRIDNSKGYILCNLQWLTTAENARKG